MLPAEHPDSGRRGPELPNPPQEASTRHSQTSLDPAVAAARSRQQLSLRCRPSLPTTLCLQYFYGFLGEWAEQPSCFFSSFLGNHLPFANKLPVSPPREGGRRSSTPRTTVPPFPLPNPHDIVSFQQDPLALVTVRSFQRQQRPCCRGHLSAHMSFHCSVTSSRENRTAGFKALTSVTQWGLTTCENFKLRRVEAWLGKGHLRNGPYLRGWPTNC